MKRLLTVITTAMILAGAPALVGQTAADHAARAKEKVKNAASDKDVTYGRIKELTAGQKVVVDIDNAVDKTFNLADKDVKVSLGKGLKVGDPVKVSEHEVAGKAKSVTISKHSGGAMAHGDADPKAKKP